ncbi:MAG: hypothetical protein U0T77_04330 [Chitinophagales bacterium]
MLSFKNKRLLYLFFFLIIFVLYYPAQQAKFINDTLYYLYGADQTGIKGVLNSYGIIWLWQLTAFAYYVLYKLFGFHWMGWHITFSALFAYNAYLLYRLLSFHIKLFSEKIAFLSALLFLLSPFQTEVLAWGGCLHYLLIVTFLLLGFVRLLNYYTSPNIKDVVIFQLLFAGSLMCFEQAFLFPAVYFLFSLLVVAPLMSTSYKELVSLFFTKILPVNILLIGIYLLATKLSFGVWIAHYRADNHLNLQILPMYDTYMKYNLKFLLYFRYLPVGLKSVIESPFLQHIFMAIHLILFFATLAYSIYRKNFKSPAFLMLLFFYLSYVCMLLPVLNLDTSFNFEIQSDRYGYIASVFFYPLLVFILYRLFDKSLFSVIILLEVVCSLYFVVHNVQLWNKAGEITMDLVKNYPLQNNQKAYVLNLPDNYAGAYMLRNGFTRALSLVHHKDYLSSAEETAAVNIFSKEKETITTKLNDSTYYVKCDKPGKWYMYRGLGAVDYEKENYKVDFDEWNTAYTLIIKKAPKDTTYLLQCEGDKWRIIDTLLPTSKFRQ